MKAIYSTIAQNVLLLEPVFIKKECWIGEGILMARDTKKRHKADAYGGFLGKRGAKFTAKTALRLMNTGS